jgi:hypothetical protein
MRRLIVIALLVAVLAAVAACGSGSQETLMTQYGDVPSSVGVVKARVENRIREKNGPDAAGCKRAADPEAESGHEVWECAMITASGGFKAHLRISVDPATGDYSILGCRGVPERSQLPPARVCSEMIR